MSDMTLESQISSLITQQQINANQLKTLLEQEQQALQEGASDAMMTLIAEKEKLAQQMGATQNQLVTLARSHNYTDPESGIVDFIKASDASGKLYPDWELLLELADACRRLNEANGATINLKKRYTDKGLAILRGQIGNSQTTTYSKKGVESRARSNRILNKA